MAQYIKMLFVMRLEEMHMAIQTKETGSKTVKQRSDNIKRINPDDLKGVVRKLEGLIEVVVLMFCFYFVWKAFYRNELPYSYYGNGKFILMFVYGFLVLILFYLCDSFQYGHRKLPEIVISQWISVLIVDFVTYFQLCLIGNHMLNPLPMLYLYVGELIVTFLCAYIYTAIYHQMYVPKNMVMIYGNEKAVNLKFKMDTRSDKYQITKVLNYDKGYDVIRKEITAHDAVIINDVPAQTRNDILKYCYQRGIRTYLVPKITDIIAQGAEDISLFDTPLLLVKGRGLNPVQRFVKRTFDILLCLIAMIPGIPLMLIVAAAIKLEDGGPVFYKQKRLTKDDREFEILKFRSMVVDAEKGGYRMDMRATNKDSRITKVGNIIRACRIDEFPQILNILKGDMSIVGPRPERLENAKEYKETIPEFTYRTKVKAGLTGYAQIYGKYNTSPYDKVRLDLMYIENYSFFLDIKLIFMTLQILVKPESTEGFDKEKQIDNLRNTLLAEEKLIGAQEVSATREDSGE